MVSIYSGLFAQVFSYKIDNVNVNLSTKQITRDKIKFGLIYKNITDKDIVKISGIAKNKKLAYFANEYIYKSNGCYLALRIDADENKRAVVKFEACEAINKKAWAPKNMLITKEYLKELNKFE